MLTQVLAHAGAPLAPHDVWIAWNGDPLLVGVFALAIWAYARGRTTAHRRPEDVRRARCFAGAMVALVAALMSPLDAMSGALASAHMVQHLLLTLVAAPLVALSAPSSSLLRGTPLAARQAASRVRRRLGLASRSRRFFRYPATAWLLHTAALWFWHSAVAYDAALDHSGLHAAEHAAFFFTGVLFWRLLVGGRGGGTVSPGLGVLLVFGMALQSVFLSVLLTFAEQPWYSGYATTTAAWGLDPLADQHLAGVIMWVPAGLLYLGAALALLNTWLAGMERDDTASAL